MLLDNINFQLAAVLILLIIIADYNHNPHLKLLSNNYFRNFLILVGINLVFDFVTEYTTIYMDTIPRWSNIFCHQCFLGSTVWSMYFMFFYIRSLAYEEKRVDHVRKLLSVVPIIIATVIILFGEIEFLAWEKGIYTYGPMVVALYFCGAIYLVLSLVISLDKRNNLKVSQRQSIRVGLIIWTITMGMQKMFPNLSLSGLGFTLLILSTYFSFENHRQFFDNDTKTFNKSAFHKMMTEYYESGRAIFVINVNLDNYEQINSLLGHDTGLDALVYLREIIRSNFKTQEIYHSRSSSFSLFSLEDIPTLQTKLERLEYALSNSNYKAAKLKCQISVIDVKKYTKSIDDVYEMMNFMTDNLKKDNCSIHCLDEEIVRKKERKERISGLLIDALENDGFEMYYQPIYWSNEKKIKSAEALIRLKQEAGTEYISPEEFIPIAEERGMIMAIGDCVIKKVAEFINKYDLQHSQLEYIEVNLSAIQMVHQNIDKRFMSILEQYHIDPKFINIEITETAAVEVGENFTENLMKFRKLGFSFSMDDFGTGYSNLSQICQMNYDLVKLDRSLIWPIFNEKRDKLKAKAVLESVVKMLNEINIGIVAEGVETEEMKSYLIALGVQHLQGYYFSKPINKESFIKLLKEDTGSNG